MKSVPSRSLKHGKEIWSPLYPIPFSLCILYSIQGRALCNLFTRYTFGLGAYIIDALLLLGHLALNLCQLHHSVSVLPLETTFLHSGLSGS